MKNSARTLALLVVCALATGSVTGAEPRSPKPLRLEISMTDGSVLFGEATMAGVQLISDGLGNLNLPMGSIGAISFSPEHDSAIVTFRNGDRMRGKIAVANGFNLKTLFGPISVPLEAVQELRVHPGGSGTVADWDVLPFPKGSDWPSERGEPAKVGADEIVLRGQPVCTKQSYSAPMSFECEATLDQLVSDDGCLWIDLIPDGPDAELNVPPQNVAIQLGYHQRGPDGGMFTIALRGGAPVNLNTESFGFEAGKPYRLEIEVTPDTIRATLNGQAFESKVTIPFKTFHIELMGWQPANIWRVRDFIVH